MEGKQHEKEMKLQRLLKNNGSEEIQEKDESEAQAQETTIEFKEDKGPKSSAPKGKKMASSVDAKVVRPTQYDVLFGRGKPYQGHAGNIRLHKIVDFYKPRYVQARRHVKTEIAEEIVQFIKSGTKAGRFLKRIDGEEGWEEVSDTVARDKVSHALRGKSRNETPAEDEDSKGESGVAKRSSTSELGAPDAKKQRVTPGPGGTPMASDFLGVRQRAADGLIDPMAAGRVYPSALSAAAMPVGMFNHQMRLMPGFAPMAGAQLYNPVGGLGLTGIIPAHQAMPAQMLANREFLASYLHGMRSDGAFLAPNPSRLYF